MYVNIYFIPILWKKTKLISIWKKKNPKFLILFKNKKRGKLRYFTFYKALISSYKSKLACLRDLWIPILITFIILLIVVLGISSNRWESIIENSLEHFTLVLYELQNSRNIES